MPSIPTQPQPKTFLVSKDIKDHEQVKDDNEKVDVEQKLKHIMKEYGCGELIDQEGLIDALHHIYGLGKQEFEEKQTVAPMTTNQIRPVEPSEPSQVHMGGPMEESKETVNEFAPGDIDTNGGPSATAPNLNKKSRAILDGAITACAMAKDAQGRIQALQDYCNKHGVSYNQLYNLITMETGGDYFVKDTVPGSDDTNESKTLVKSYKDTLNKIK